MTMTFDGDRVDQRVSTRVITQSSTMPRRACSPCCCRPCSRASRTAPAQIPITTPPRMARQLHSKPMKMGLAPLPFLSLRLLVCFFPPALLVTNTRPASAMLRCRRCRRCAAPAALPKLPKLQNTSQLLTPPRIEAGYSIER